MKIKQLIMGAIVLPLTLSINCAALAQSTGYAKCDEEYINIRSEASLDGEVVGKIYDDGQVIIHDTVDGWYKVTSGNVEGYIKSDYVVVDNEEAAEEAAYKVAYVYPQVLNVRSAPSEDAAEIDQVYEGQEVEVVDIEGDWAKVCLAPDSYGYISAYYIDYKTYYGTAETLEEEQERLDKEWLDYLAAEEAKAAAEEAAYLEYLESLNATYQEEDYTQDYYDDSNNYYYEDNSSSDYYYDDDSDDYSYQDTTSNSSVTPTVTETTTNTTTTTTTPTPTVTSDSSSGGGKYLSDYAKQYIGNPYVWGGTSLSTGADCSGFTKAVLNANGISVNGRTAADQAAGGKKISLSEAQAGDLIYYNNGSGVYHIAIYNGDGTVTHSSSSTTGVTISDMNYSGNAAGAVRYW